MTRIYVAVAAAFLVLAVLPAPPASACVSCEYTPEVVNTPVGPKAKKRAATKTQQARPAKKRVVKRAPPVKAPQVSKAAATPAKTAPAGDAEGADTPSAVGTPPRAGTATTAFAEREAAKAEAAAAPPVEVGCKRYSAQAGTTVTVPCP